MSDRDVIEQLKAMPQDEASALIDRMLLATWGVTREQLMALSGDEVTAIAEARGLSVAGMVGGKTFSHEGDGKDHRN